MKEGKSDLWNIVSLLKKVIFGSFAVIVSIVFMFVLYLIKTSDKEISSTIDATGVYILVDSEGNVLATDLTPEDIDKIMEFLNGKN